MNILRLPKLLYSCVAFCCCQALTVSLSAQQQKVDTARTYSIPEVTVAEAYHTREVRAMAPTQVFSKEELKSLNVLQVSDAVKHFAGVTVKDYGGIGGLKTVSLRSLGAEHTAVGYDGITISDCPDGTNRHRTFLTGQCRPPVTQQRTKRQHLSARKVFRFRRDTEHTDTDTAIQRQPAYQPECLVQNGFVGTGQSVSPARTETEP